MWAPSPPKFNEHPMMVTPRVFRVPVLGVSVKVSMMEVFGHLSFVLLGAAYMTRDVITLRCVAIGGLSAAVVFQFFRPVPLWLPLRWNLVFVGINAVWVARLWWEEHLAHLEITEEERELQRKHFSHMPERDFWHLLHCGEWVEFPVGAELTREGESPTRVYAAGQSIHTPPPQLRALTLVCFIDPQPRLKSAYFPRSNLKLTAKTCCGVNRHTLVRGDERERSSGGEGEEPQRHTHRRIHR